MIRIYLFYDFTTIESRYEKPCLLGFRQGPTQIGMYSRGLKCRCYEVGRFDYNVSIQREGIHRSAVPLFLHMQNVGFLMTWLIYISFHYNS